MTFFLLSGNIFLNTETMLSPLLYEKWFFTVFRAHYISAFIASFVITESSKVQLFKSWLGTDEGQLFTHSDIFKLEDDLLKSSVCLVFLLWLFRSASPIFEISTFFWHLIWYSRACGSYHDFLDRGLLLIKKLLNQGFPLVQWKPSFRHFTVATMTWLTRTESMSQICSICRKHFTVLSSFMTSPGL